MAAKNDITGDNIQTRVVSDTYRNNYDLIFGKKKKQEEKKDDEGCSSDSDNREQTPE